MIFYYSNHELNLYNSEDQSISYSVVIFKTITTSDLSHIIGGNDKKIT